MNEDSTKSILLRHARIIAPHKVIEEGDVLIESGRIARIFDSANGSPPTAATEIDLAGLTLFPGFIDIHIHGAVGVDMMTAGADDLRRVAEFLAPKGVTGWMPTLVPASEAQYQHACKTIDESMRAQREMPTGSLGSQVLGVHYEGPFVNSEQCGALHREYFRIFRMPADLDALPRIKNEGAVHMMTLAPEIEGGIDLIKDLRRRGWIVSIGHTRANLHVLDEALQAGARHMTHFMNAMSPLHQRKPGPVGWGLTQDEVTCDVIADGVHLDPSVLKLILRAKTSKRVSLISDAIAAAGLGDGDYQIWGEQIAVKNGRTRNGKGSIAGSVITMLDAMRLMRSIGSGDSEIARMASLNPARVLGIDDDCGSIQEGKRADLVALDRDGSVWLTIINGMVANQQ